MAFRPRRSPAWPLSRWAAAAAVFCLLLVSALLAWSAGRSQSLIRHALPLPRVDAPCPAPTPTKRILLWTGFWEEYSDSWERLFFKMVEKRCPVSACELVYDHRNLPTADAVVFHIRDVLNTTEVPQWRPSGQPWVVFTLEAPPAMDAFPVDYSLLRGVINWTMSYRLDSDIVVPYGRVLPRATADQSSNHDHWSEKLPDHHVVWMVSHCSTDSRREWYVKELAKYIRVDVVGKCGFLKCGRHISIKTLKASDQDNCDEMASQYFFYLAFENAICEDYVTEKFFMALERNVVPVVLGGADYAAMAPPKSFINALDFPSPEALAQTLNIIMANKTIYNQFFDWRREYTAEVGHPFDPMICDLCARLHGAPQQNPRLQKPTQPIPGLASRTHDLLWPNGTYKDIEDWFVRGSSCRRWWGGEMDYKMHQPIVIGPRPDSNAIDQPGGQDIIPAEDDRDQSLVMGNRPPEEGGDQPLVMVNRPAEEDGDQPLVMGNRPAEEDGDQPLAMGNRPAEEDGDQPLVMGNRPAEQDGDQPLVMGNRPAEEDGDQPLVMVNRPAVQDEDQPLVMGDRSVADDEDQPLVFGNRAVENNDDRLIASDRSVEDDKDQPVVLDNRLVEDDRDQAVALDNRPVEGKVDQLVVLDNKPVEDAFGQLSLSDRRPVEDSFDQLLSLNQRPVEDSIELPVLLDQKSIEDFVERPVLFDQMPVEDSLEQPVLLDQRPVEDSIEQPILLDKMPVEDSLEQPVLLDQRPVEDSIEQPILLDNIPFKDSIGQPLSLDTRSIEDTLDQPFVLRPNAENDVIKGER